MQFKINRKEFLNALRIGGSMAGRTKYLPILDCVKVTIKGDKAVISSFDNEFAVTKRVQLDGCYDDAVFCVNPNDLSKVLRSIREDDLVFSVDDKKITTKHRFGRISLPALPADEFPRPFTEERHSVKVDGRLLFEWLNKSRVFVADDTLRPAMCGVYFYVKDREIGVAASDGQRLYCDSRDFECFEDLDVNAIISSKCIPAVLDMINGYETVSVEIGERSVRFVVEDALFHCRKIESRFPNFKAILPHNNTIRVELSKALFTDSLNRAMIASNAMTSLIKVSTSSDSVKLESEDIEFSKKGVDECQCSCNGGDIIIGMRGNFLKQCIDAVSHDSLCLEMSSPSSPVLVTDKECPNQVILLMPMIIS